MAITMNLYYTGENGAAIEFVREMLSSGTVKAIREEKGNIRYDYFVKIDEPNTVLLIDSWESQAAIDLHHSSPMMKRIIELREKYDLHMRAERYVSDEEGISSEAAKYIRS